MYIWTGADVDSQLEEIKSITEKIEGEIGFEHSNFTLPFHISLKMSFCVDDEKVDEVIDSLIGFYKSVEPFEVSVKGIEHFGNIVWIRMDEGAELNSVHDALNKMLGEEFGVGLHPYDCDYLFHTTLFLDDDGGKIDAAYEKVRCAPLPQKLLINKFVIGTSPNGELGSYKVVNCIELKGCRK